MGRSSKPNSKEDYIVTCSCRDTPKFAKEVFEILCPGQGVPDIILRTDIPKFAIGYDGTIFGNYLNMLYVNKEKFAYYFKISDDGDITEQWDLLKGFRVL